MALILSGSDGVSDVDGSAATPAVRGSDTNTGIYFPGADRIGFAEGGVQVGEFDASGNFLMNSGYGSPAIAYGCRAWVNFNGTGTVAIRASGNVTSITDNGTGNYTVNFSNSMPDGSYACSLGIGNDSGSSGAGWWVSRLPTHSTTGCQILTGRPDNGAYADASVVNAAFFR